MGNNIWKIWKTTRKQQGNEWKTCGDNWKANSGKQIGIVKGFNMSSQTGRQMNCYKGRQMNWRHPESPTPPARLGDKWIAIREDKWIGDIRRAGHHQPDWETNELLYKGRQMTWRHPESRTPPARLGDKWIAIRGDKWIRNIRRAGHYQKESETNELL